MSFYLSRGTKPYFSWRIQRCRKDTVTSTPSGHNIADDLGASSCTEVLNENGKGFRLVGTLEQPLRCDSHCHSFPLPLRCPLKVGAHPSRPFPETPRAPSGQLSVPNWSPLPIPFFPRASERRVLPIVGVCKHLLLFTSSHPHMFPSSHPHIFTSRFCCFGHGLT